MLADIRPNEDHAKDYIIRSPVITVTQCVPEMSEHEANTTAVTYANKAMSHVEGGWPKDIDYTEAEHTIRYRKKIEKDEDYIRTVCNLGSAVEDLIKQNNAIDIYEQYFEGMCTDHSTEAPSAKTVALFKDPTPMGRGATYINWHPDGLSKVVVSYAIMAFQQQPAGMPLSSYIWDLGNPNVPEYELSPSSQICCAKFNLKDANVIGSGLYNGQIALFDVRKGSSHIDSTPIDVSHQDPVYDFAWLQSKTGTECMSVSTDGHVHCWDTRKTSERLETIPLREKGSETLYGGVSLEYDPTAGPTKFMVGTEQGVVLSCNRKAKHPADRVGSAFPGHHGPVYSLRRNPFFPKYFLSIGDWTARIWNEDLRAPLMTTQYHSSYLTSGTWSPSRPGVFFTTKMDGTLDVWDLFYKHNAPSLHIQVADVALNSFSIQDNGPLCAVGSAAGNVAVMQLSPGLCEMAQNEKAGINAMLERETLREKNLEKAIKEAKVKARKEAARKDEVADNVNVKDLEALQEEFMKLTSAVEDVGVGN